MVVVTAGVGWEKGGGGVGQGCTPSYAMDEFWGLVHSMVTVVGTTASHT